MSETGASPFGQPPDRPPAPSPAISRAAPVGRGTLALGLVLALIGAGLATRWWAGPGAETVVVGRVSSGGRPVVFGTVTILAGDDRAYSATIGRDGRFEVANLPPGPVRIAVSSPDPRPIQRRPDAAAGPPPETLAGGSRAGAAAPPPPGQPGPAAAVTPPGRSIAAPAPMSPAEAQPVSQPTERPGWFRIPGRYADPATSGLRARIDTGENRIDLDLD